MLLPIADSPHPGVTPRVTWLLIGLNVMVYLLLTLPLGLRPPGAENPLLPEYLRVLGVQGPVSYATILEHLSAYDLLVFEYGFRPASFSLLTLFSSLFLHAGFFHLAGNMLFLYLFGNNVESRLGSLKFLSSYLFFGLVATLFFALFAPGSTLPLIGASGAISGIMGCYFLWFPKNRVKLLVFLPFQITIMQVPARWVLGFYLLIVNLLPFLALGAAGSGVAHGAHLGGFMAGLGLAFFSERLSLAWPLKKPAAWTEQTACSPQAIPLAVEAGEVAAASHCYLELEQVSQRKAVPPETVLALGDYLLAAGEQKAALRVFRRFIAERQASPGLDRAYLATGTILLQQPRYATSAYHYLLSAIDIASSEEVEAAARAGILRIEALQKGRGRPLFP